MGSQPFLAVQVPLHLVQVQHCHLRNLAHLSGSLAKQALLPSVTPCCLQLPPRRLLLFWLPAEAPARRVPRPLILMLAKRRGAAPALPLQGKLLLLLQRALRDSC